MRRLVIALMVAGFVTVTNVGCGGGAAKTVPAPKIEGATGEAPPSGEEPSLPDEGP